MPTIKIATQVEAPPERCFDLARDIDFHIRSMAGSGEAAIGGRVTGLIGPEEEVTFQGRHFGIVHTHRSRLTVFDRPRHFRDVMLAGRFKRFEHDHFFEPSQGGTFMRDVVGFESPFGVIGRLVDRLVMTGYLSRLIAKRCEAIKAEAEASSGP